MADLVICEYNDIKDIADAVRSKAGSDELMPFDSIATTIEGIKDGGILGHPVASGSFTLAEDTTSSHTILTVNELFEAVKDDFPGATTLTDTQAYFIGNSTSATPMYNFLVGICWIDNTGQFDTDLNSSELLASFLPRSSLNDTSSVIAYADSWGNFSGKKPPYGVGLKIDYTGVSFNFSSSYLGFAGSKYNWAVFPLDHGEVV